MSESPPSTNVPVVGAHAVLYNRKGHDDALRTWACKLMGTKPFKLVAVALANKMARIAFALLTQPLKLHLLVAGHHDLLWINDDVQGFDFRVG